MALLVGALWRWEGPRAALIVCLLFTTSTHTCLWVPNQSDNWIVAVAVLLSAWCGWRALQSGGTLAWWSSSILFGISLSYRLTLGVAVAPLAVFFVQEMGAARAARWMGVAGGLTVALCVGPLLWAPTTYLAGPVAMARNKVAQDVPGATWWVALLTVSTLAWASWRVRGWADVWMATALSLAAMVTGVVATRLPEGISAATASYETVAYNGTFLVLALAVRRGAVAGGAGPSVGRRTQVLPSAVPAATGQRQSGSGRKDLTSVDGVADPPPSGVAHRYRRSSVNGSGSPS